MSVLGKNNSGFKQKSSEAYIDSEQYGMKIRVVLSKQQISPKLVHR